MSSKADQKFVFIGVGFAYERYRYPKTFMRICWFLDLLFELISFYLNLSVRIVAYQFSS